jgi:hypothetical protein
VSLALFGLWTCRRKRRAKSPQGVAFHSRQWTIAQCPGRFPKFCFRGEGRLALCRTPIGNQALGEVAEPHAANLIPRGSPALLASFATRLHDLLAACLAARCQAILAPQTRGGGRRRQASGRGRCGSLLACGAQSKVSFGTFHRHAFWAHVLDTRSGHTFWTGHRNAILLLATKAT